MPQAQSACHAKFVAFGKLWKHELVFFFWGEGRKEGIREEGGSTEQEQKHTETAPVSQCFRKPKHSEKTQRRKPRLVTRGLGSPLVGGARPDLT